MKLFAYLSGLCGLALALWLTRDAGFADIAKLIASTGWSLLWIVPFHIIPLLPDVVGWRLLLAPRDPSNRAGTAYLFWVATVREAINRLLPVASVGGELAGVRLVIARGLDGTAVSASVIIEILLTLFSQYLFAAVGVVILFSLNHDSQTIDTWIAGLGASLILPLLLAALLRYLPVFTWINGLADHVLGQDHRITSLLRSTADLDQEIRALFGRPARLVACIALQSIGMALYAFEVWFVLRQLGHPVTPGLALMIEALIQTARQFAFMVPGGLGVQEAGLVLLGQLAGFDATTAIALSLAKRMRELIFGLPALLSWQWMEWRRYATGKSGVNH